MKIKVIQKWKTSKQGDSDLYLIAYNEQGEIIGKQKVIADGYDTNKALILDI